MTDAAILAVDDNRANLTALEATLTPLGHKLETAADAEEALLKLLKQEFALLLLDVHLPGMSGFELAGMLKQHSRLSRLPIIFITGVSRDAKQVFEGYAHGAVDYLLKPYEPELLRAKVSVFVDLYRGQQKIREQAELLHRHEMRQIRRQGEEQLRDLVESMPTPVLRMRDDGRVIVCNSAWTEYSGLRAEQTGDLCSGRLLHQDDLQRFRHAWKNAVDLAMPFEVECRLRRRDGKLRWHLVRGVPRAAARGGGAECIVVATDIHTKKLMEAERLRILDLEHRAREDAEAASRMKDEFLATVSHELRTPLNAILGWCSMLRSGMASGERAKQALETIVRNAEAQARLVNDLLDVSRIVTGKLRMQPSRLKLRDVLADAIATVRPAADAKTIAIALEDECPDEMDLVVTGDRARLQQVAWNLLANAVKFTPDGGRVVVRVGRDGNRVHFSVEDDGPGIPQDLLPHVFDRFRQGDSSTTRKHDGLGLGLSIVKHLVEAHGGTITVQSGKPRAGAVFRVELPVSDAAHEEPRQASLERPTDGAAPPVHLGGVRVLFVDDQEEDREMMTTALSSWGASVRAVGSVADAVRAIAEATPDILISDIAMPKQSGYELVQHVRALPAEEGGNMPAIALTAYGRPEDARRARDAGFQLHLTKPVDLHELATIVGSLCGKAHRDSDPSSGPVVAADAASPLDASRADDPAAPAAAVH